MVDGDVLADAAYADARMATGFVQSRPFEGQPASERTEVRIVYTEDTLYFGIVCYTDDSATIIAADSRRDSDLTETDSFRIILDTYHDGLNGFVFGTNPAGVEYDGQLTNEGQGSGRFGGGGSGRPSNNRQQRGSGGGLNVNWDGVWQVVASVTDVGWTAEIAIPFRTLRYPPTDVQTWGMNFQRNIRFNNEQAYWSPLPRQFTLNRLTLAGELQGLSVPAQRNLQFMPYVLGDAAYRSDTASTARTGDVGADLKYSISPSMTLDATINTDFAQVEVDDEQVNLDRFTLFFPEKRPFFLENAGLFSVGQSGAVDIFFSRRIGLGESGEQIPILGGGRLSGKVGNNTNIGFLNMQTGAVDSTGTPQQNFTVGRVRQDLANRSNVGAMFVNRQARGALAGDQDYNRTYALDGRWGIGEGGTLSGFVSGTDTPGGLAENNHAYAFSAQHQSPNARLSLGFTEVAPNFNPEVGFLARRSYRRMNGSVFTTLRPDNFWGVHEFPAARLPQHGLRLRDRLAGDAVHAHRQPHRVAERLRDPHRHERHAGGSLRAVRDLSGGRRAAGALRPQRSADCRQHQPGRTDQRQLQHHRRGPVRREARHDHPVGSPLGPARRSTRCSSGATTIWSFPAGRFTTNLIRLRTSYSFTTRMFLQALRAVQRPGEPVVVESAVSACCRTPIRVCSSSTTTSSRSGSSAETSSSDPAAR